MTAPASVAFSFDRARERRPREQAEALGPMGRLRQWRSMLARTHNKLSNEALADLMEGWLASKVTTDALASLLIAKGLITGSELEAQKERQAVFMCWVLETKFAGFRARDGGVVVTNAALAHQTPERLAERDAVTV